MTGILSFARITSRFRNLPRSVRIVGATLLVVLAVQFLFDPLTYLLNIGKLTAVRAELPLAKSRWESHRILDYAIDVRVSKPPVCWLDLTLIVRKGQFSAIAQQRRSDNLHEPMCSYNDLTVDNMFRRVEQELRSINAGQDAITVAFDNEYGYVSQYQYAAGYRLGLLTAVSVGDCCSTYVFSNFQPIASTP